MRKAYCLALLFACAACADEKDGSTSARGEPEVAGNAASGGGEETADSDDGAGDSASAPGVPSAAVPGVASGSGSTVAAGFGGGGASVGGTAAGTSGASLAGPFPGIVSDPAGIVAPLPPTTPAMPTVKPVAPTPQGGQLTAGAWDDNLNYARFTEFRNKVAQQRSNGILPFTAADFEAAHTKFSAPRAAHQQLDVALVIDTTGSMGDEIAYLQREFTDLSTAIEQAYPAAEQRWALVVYKDVGDLYVTRQFDFRSDLNALRTDLAAQSAGGGGDFPEAPDAAFEQINQFQWRTGDAVARLAFWIADAPHHDAKASAMAAALRSTQEQGIHVYPVASSGIDEFTELSMRTSAQLTGGRYLFLTNDSGIGGSHKEPSIPCYFVTRLDHAILRMVDIEMSGIHSEPTAEQIIRTGGNPKDGACALESGELTVF
jgi:hypothetical protein